MASEDYTSIRRLIPVASLGDDAFDTLMTRTRVETLAAGQTLFSQGDKNAEYVYLLSGEVGFYIGSLRVESIPAESSAARFALAHQIPRKVTAVAQTAIEIIRIQIADLPGSIAASGIHSRQTEHHQSLEQQLAETPDDTRPEETPEVGQIDEDTDIAESASTILKRIKSRFFSDSTLTSTEPAPPRPEPTKADEPDNPAPGGGVSSTPADFADPPGTANADDTEAEADSGQTPVENKVKAGHDDPEQSAIPELPEPTDSGLLEAEINDQREPFESLIEKARACLDRGEPIPPDSGVEADRKPDAVSFESAEADHTAPAADVSDDETLDQGQGPLETAASGRETDTPSPFPPPDAVDTVAPDHDPVIPLNPPDPVETPPDNDRFVAKKEQLLAIHQKLYRQVPGISGLFVFADPGMSMSGDFPETEVQRVFAVFSACTEPKPVQTETSAAWPVGEFLLKGTEWQILVYRIRNRQLLAVRASSATGLGLLRLECGIALEEILDVLLSATD